MVDQGCWERVDAQPLPPSLLRTTPLDTALRVWRACILGVGWYVEGGVRMMGLLVVVAAGSTICLMALGFWVSDAFQRVWRCGVLAPLCPHRASSPTGLHPQPGALCARTAAALAPRWEGAPRRPQRTHTQPSSDEGAQEQQQQEAQQQAQQAQQAQQEEGAQQAQQAAQVQQEQPAARQSERQQQ